MTLVIENVSASFQEGARKRAVLQDIRLKVDTGTFVSVIGPSGCGKSTLCNLIAGVDLPDQGEIILDGSQIQGISGQVGYMPQKDLLLPWRTLWENVALGCDIRKQDKQASRQAALAYLNQFGLGEFKKDYPYQLSGGMRQRGALLRTILFGRSTLVLDEPFGALDALTRREMQQWLLSVWEQTKNTVLFITHDMDEAVLMSDEIVVLSRIPARVIETVRIPFSRPRDPELLLAPEAIKIKKYLIKLLLA